MRICCAKKKHRVLGRADSPGAAAVQRDICQDERQQQQQRLQHRQRHRHSADAPDNRQHLQRVFEALCRFISLGWRDGSEGSRHPFYRSAQERLSEIYGFTSSTRTLLLNFPGGDNANFVYSHIPCLALDDFAAETSVLAAQPVPGIVNALLFWQELGEEFKCVYLLHNSPPQALARKGHIGMAWRSDVFAGLLSHVLHLLQKLQGLMLETSSDFMNIEGEIKAFEKKQQEALSYENVREAEDLSDKLRLLQEQHMSLGSSSSSSSSSNSMLFEGAFYDALDFLHTRFLSFYMSPAHGRRVRHNTVVLAQGTVAHVFSRPLLPPASAVTEITKDTVDGFPAPLHDDYRKGREMLPFLFCLTSLLQSGAYKAHSHVTSFGSQSVQSWFETLLQQQHRVHHESLSDAVGVCSDDVPFSFPNDDASFFISIFNVCASIIAQSIDAQQLNFHVFPLSNID
jgi:hypothetical protein